MNRWIPRLLILLFFQTGIAAQGPQEQKGKQSSLAALVSSTNQFTLDLYRTARERPGNLFLSPFGVSSTIAMAYAGANGQTAREIATTLRLPVGSEDIHSSFAELQKSLSSGSGYELRSANALWVQKGFPLLPKFSNLLATNYQASSRELDFVENRGEALNAINNWVKSQTNGKIPKILEPDMIDSLTRLVLTNAVYFKGEWLSKFSKDATQPAPFSVSAARRVNVPFMRQIAGFRYLETPEVQVLEMLYMGKGLSMVLLLPKGTGAIGPLEASLDKNLVGWIGALKEQEVDVSLPKLKIASTLALKPMLSRMGIHDAFIAEKADFSAITGTKNLYISAVAHKAFVELDERGTEAAAATGLVARTLSSRKTFTFRADHPFLFLIRHVRTGAILFSGRAADPSVQ